MGPLTFRPRKKVLEAAACFPSETTGRACRPSTKAFLAALNSSMRFLSCAQEEWIRHRWYHRFRERGGALESQKQTRNGESVTFSQCCARHSRLFSNACNSGIDLSHCSELDDKQHEVPPSVPPWEIMLLLVSRSPRADMALMAASSRARSRSSCSSPPRLFFGFSINAGVDEALAMERFGAVFAGWASFRSVSAHDSMLQTRTRSNQQ